MVLPDEKTDEKYAAFMDQADMKLASFCFFGECAHDSVSLFGAILVMLEMKGLLLK